MKRACSFEFQRPRCRRKLSATRKNSDSQDEGGVPGKATQTSRCSGIRKLEVDGVVVMNIGGPKGERRSAVGEVINERRGCCHRSRTNRQSDRLLLQRAILNRTNMAVRRIGRQVGRFVAGRLLGAGLRRIAHSCLAKRVANRREQQQNGEDKYRKASNGRQFLLRKAHGNRLRHAAKCVKPER